MKIDLSKTKEGALQRIFTINGVIYDCFIERHLDADKEIIGYFAVLESKQILGEYYIDGRRHYSKTKERDIIKIYQIQKSPPKKARSKRK